MLYYKKIAGRGEALKIKQATDFPGSVPLDRALRRSGRLRGYLPLLWLGLWLAVWIASIAAYGKESPSVSPLRMAVVSVGTGIVGVLLFRVWRVFRGDVEGRILKVKTAHAYRLFRTERGKNERDFHVRVVLKVDTGRKSMRGRPIVRRVNFPQRNGTYMYYREGDTVCRWRGLPFPESTAQAVPGARICVFCGEYTEETERTRCAVCDRPLPDRYGNRERKRLSEGKG